MFFSRYENPFSMGEEKGEKGEGEGDDGEDEVPEELKQDTVDEEGDGRRHVRRKKAANVSLSLSLSHTLLPLHSLVIFLITFNFTSNRKFLDVRLGTLFCCLLLSVSPSWLTQFM
jgi:hypothetical protein